MAGGRPSKYRAEYAEQAYKYCLLGATDAKLANLFEVDEATINRWKESHPQFCESIKKGKDIADAEIAEALYHRAKGYSHKAVKMFNNNGEILVEEYTEHYPPDTGAAMAWLKNRQPHNWRDKQEIDTTLANKDGKPFETRTNLTGLSTQELMQLEQILAKASESG